MINPERYSQFGEEGLNPKGIVIVQYDKKIENAQKLLEYYDEESKEPYASHFIIDSTDILEAIPTNWKVRCINTYSNWCYDNCIVIEILSLTSTEYFSCEQLLISLIKRLCNEYNISLDEIYGYRDFNITIYNPYQILNKYKTIKNFVDINIKEN